MSDIKQLLEKATRKTEMRWRVFAFDPEQDNKLVHTSKDAFDCIKMAGEYKMDLAKKNPNYIIEIVAESAQKNEAKPSKDDLEKAAYSSSFMNHRANVTIDGKTYVKIGKDKWEYQSSQSSVLGPSYSTAQLLQKIQQATKVELTESAQKNEEKEFTIKLVTPFGKAKVCSWKANSVDAAVKEFLDANPAYRENKKGAVIAESISDDIVREVKEEVKDGVKDLVQQDVDAKLNGEITPKDYQANFEEDVDDDSDGIFGDELDNVEPDELE